MLSGLNNKLNGTYGFRTPLLMIMGPGSRIDGSWGDLGLGSHGLRLETGVTQFCSSLSTSNDSSKGGLTTRDVLEVSGYAGLGSSTSTLGVGVIRTHGSLSFNSNDIFLDAKVENFGTATLNRSGVVVRDLTNAASGTMTAGKLNAFEDLGTQYVGRLGYNAKILNQGLFEKLGRGATHILNGFSNEGAVAVKGGQLWLESNGSHKGSFDESGGELIFYGQNTLKTGSHVHSDNDIQFSGQERYEGGEIDAPLVEIYQWSDANARAKLTAASTLWLNDVRLERGILDIADGQTVSVRDLTSAVRGSVWLGSGSTLEIRGDADLPTGYLGQNIPESQAQINVSGTL